MSEERVKKIYNECHSLSAWLANADMQTLNHLFNAKVGQWRFQQLEEALHNLREKLETSFISKG